MIEHAVFYSNLEKLNQDLSKVDSMELLTLRSRLNMVDNQKNDTSQILPPPTPQSGREDSRYPPRLYFGQEFCERLAPSLEDLDRVLGMVASKK